jgi:hypothetical protein
MLSDAERTEMRATLAEVLAATATVKRYNGVTHAWDTVGTHACRVIPKRAVIRDVNGALEGITLWNLLLPHDADVRVADRLEVGAAAYVVTGTDAGRTDAIGLVAQCGSG